MSQINGMELILHKLNSGSVYNKVITLTLQISPYTYMKMVPDSAEARSASLGACRQRAWTQTQPLSP